MSCFNVGGGNCCWIIILILILFCGCGNGCGNSCDNGCGGCGNNCGNNYGTVNASYYYVTSCDIFVCSRITFKCFIHIVNICILDVINNNYNTIHPLQITVSIFQFTCFFVR